MHEELICSDARQVMSCIILTTFLMDKRVLIGYVRDAYEAVRTGPMAGT